MFHLFAATSDSVWEAFGRGSPRRSRCLDRKEVSQPQSSTCVECSWGGSSSSLAATRTSRRGSTTKQTSSPLTMSVPPERFSLSIVFMIEAWIACLKIFCVLSLLLFCTEDGLEF